MTRTIYLAGGCFWGTQRYFDCLPGVVETEVGYANGTAHRRRRDVKTARLERVGLLIFNLGSVHPTHGLAFTDTVRSRSACFA